MPAGGGERESPWTFESLYAFFMQRFQDLETRLDHRYDAGQQAIAEKDAALRDRFDSVNELRGQLNDVMARTMPREDAERRIDEGRRAREALEKRHNADLALVNQRLDMITGLTQGIDKSRAIIGWAIAAAVGLASIVSFVIILLDRK